MIRKRTLLLVLYLMIPALAWGHPSFNLSIHPHIQPHLHLHLHLRPRLVVGIDGRTELTEIPTLPMEVKVRIEDLAPEERSRIQDGLRTRLGADAEMVPTWSRQTKSDPEPGGPPHPITLLQVEFWGRRNRYEGAGPVRTCLINLGRGAAVGSAVAALAVCESSGLTAPAAFEILGGGTAVGGLVGFATGPRAYRANRGRIETMGYLPWDFGLRWQIIERQPGQADKRLDHGAQRLTPASFLNPLCPSAGNGIQVRQENLRAGLEALLEDLVRRQKHLVAGRYPEGSL